MELSPRAINDMSDRNYHHHDSSKAASTFMLDAPPLEAPRPVVHQALEASLLKLDKEEAQNSKQKLKQLQQKRDRPYLILDIRDQEEYLKGRIVTSKSYPHLRLSRSVNYESKDMLKFKNVQGKLIIIVDSDESMAPKFATILIQRGYDNIFVLSGGLRVAKIKFPQMLVSPWNPALGNYFQKIRFLCNI